MNIQSVRPMLVFFALCIYTGQAKPDDTKQAEELVRKQFPILGNPGVPPLSSITYEALARTFPDYQFFALIFRQYPVARLAPEPLKSQNLFAVSKDGKVQHLKDITGLQKFFGDALGPVTDEKSSKECVEAWLRLTQVLKQEGFFQFSIPKDSLVTEKSNSGWSASGKAVVIQGGKGEIRAELIFNEAGKLTKIEEKANLKAGIRPICQATKLLDPDPVVRQMAEKDILVMGQAAKEYLDEHRVKASPELRQAIDQIWQRIIKEEW